MHRVLCWWVCTTQQDDGVPLNCLSLFGLQSNVRRAQGSAVKENIPPSCRTTVQVKGTFLKAARIYASLTFSFYFVILIIATWLEPYVMFVDVWLLCLIRGRLLCWSASRSGICQEETGASTGAAHGLQALHGRGVVLITLWRCRPVRLQSRISQVSFVHVFCIFKQTTF